MACPNSFACLGIVNSLVSYTLIYIHDLRPRNQCTSQTYHYALSNPRRFGKVHGSGQTIYTTDQHLTRYHVEE